MCDQLFLSQAWNPGHLNKAPLSQPLETAVFHYGVKKAYSKISQINLNNEFKYGLHQIKKIWIKGKVWHPKNWQECLLNLQVGIIPPWYRFMTPIMDVKVLTVAKRMEL